jgi:hypothetical protein
MKKDAPIYTVAIDPSINSLGYAVFKKRAIVSYGLLKEKKGGDYLEKARNMSVTIRSILDELSEKAYPWPDVQLVTEIPQSFGNAGYLARESGAERKLTFVAGMVYGLTPTAIAYEPQQWKGQLSKCVVRARLSKRYPKLKLYFKEVIKCPDCKMEHRRHELDHNIVDAIAIGFSHFNNGKV